MALWRYTSIWMCLKNHLLRAPKPVIPSPAVSITSLFLAIFKFCAILGVMESQPVTELFFSFSNQQIAHRAKAMRWCAAYVRLRANISSLPSTHKMSRQHLSLHSYWMNEQKETLLLDFPPIFSFPHFVSTLFLSAPSLSTSFQCQDYFR